MSQEMPKRIQPQTPMLWLAFSSAGQVFDSNQEEDDDDDDDGGDDTGVQVYLAPH